MASPNTPSASEPAKDLILVHIVQLKPMIKAHSSERLISSGIRGVVIASVHSEKTRLKKFIMMTMMIMINKLQETTVLAVARK